MQSPQKQMLHGQHCHSSYCPQGHFAAMLGESHSSGHPLIQAPIFSGGTRELREAAPGCCSSISGKILYVYTPTNAELFLLTQCIKSHIILWTNKPFLMYILY